MTRVPGGASSSRPSIVNFTRSAIGFSSVSAFEPVQAVVEFAAIMVNYIDQGARLAADCVDPLFLLFKRIPEFFKRILQKYLRSKKHLVLRPEHFVFADHGL